MDDRNTGWRRIPPILLTAFALDLAFSAAQVVARLAQSGERDYAAVDRWGLASTGMWAVFVVCFCVGMFDLAGRLAGRAAIAARVAALAYGTLFALSMAMNLMMIFGVISYSPTIFKVEQYVYWGLGTTTSIALAMVAGPRTRMLAIIGFALSMVARLPGFIGEPLFEALDLGLSASEIIYTTLGILHTVAYLVLVYAATDGVETPRRELASGGFALAASALWLRVIAAVSSVLLMVVALGGSGGDGAAKIMKFAMMAGLVVNLVSFAMFGVGALRVARSAVDGIGRHAAAVAAAASLWCAGVMFDQLPYTYKILYGDDGFGAANQERLAALSIAMPLIATLAGAILAAVISGLGRARNDEPLVSSAGAAGVGYVLLMLASIGITSFLVEKATSTGSLVGMMLVAAGCGLAAQMMLAKVCRTASASIDAEPGLPKARINDPI